MQNAVRHASLQTTAGYLKVEPAALATAAQGLTVPLQWRARVNPGRE